MRPVKSTTHNWWIRNPPARSWQQSDTWWKRRDGFHACIAIVPAISSAHRKSEGRSMQESGPKSGEQELGIEPIPAYSPQARGRSERNFGTWQGRLPQELRIRNIRTVEEANHFLWTYIAEFNRKFAVPAAQPGTAFVPVTHLNL